MSLQRGISRRVGVFACKIYEHCPHTHMIKLRTILLRSSRGSLHSPGSILIRNQEISVNSTVEGCSHSLYTVGFAPAANERLEFMKKEPGSPVHFSRFPLPGQRILRSVISVWLCIVVYYLRGRRGEPFYSIIAALQCIQPYSSSMLSEGRDRIIGTFIGAFWGAAIVFSELLPIGGSFETALIHYSLLGLLTGLVIYSTVLLKIPQYALFSAMVFLGISMYHLEDANPYIHVFNRTMDTIIGVVIAILVNSAHLPRTRDRETLYVSGIDHVLFREDRQLSRYTTVELNRFLDDGMRFTVSTKQTPATVRELLSEINLRLPIIAMDGAVLYNLNSMRYIRTVKMSPNLVTLVTDFLHSKGFPFFINTVQDDLLVIYFKDYKDLILEDVKDAHHNTEKHTEDPDFSLSKSAYLSMAKLYRKKRVSPYRNYVRTDNAVTRDVVYILVIDREENIDRLHHALMAQPWADRCRTNFDTFDCDEGEKIMRIYTAGATRANMLEHLQRYAGAPRVITFDKSRVYSSENNIYIEDPGRDSVVKELKKRFAPVSLRGWKNIFHL